jgi:UDP-3-O-[3-hydroxymyristoyl] glucosamine N-acyltransferase
MSEPVFFESRGELTIGEIVALTGAEPRPDLHLDRRINNIAPLDRAGPADLTFLENARYLRHVGSTRAGACLIAQRFESHAPSHVAVLRTREPFRAFVTVARALFPQALRPSPFFPATAIAGGAFVHPKARLEAGVTIEAAAVVGPDVEVGAGTIIGAGATIGAGVRIGRDCAIGARVSMTHAMIGDRVIIHPGCCIGQDGFGYVLGASSHLKVPQVGRVVIQDDVEIGAGTTIDRGAVRDTVIGEGTKIDNLVQVGHNVTIGRHCVIVAQSGISGSATLEDFVLLGARVGLANHVTIGEGAQITAASGVRDDVPPGERWGGTPAKPAGRWFQELALIERLVARRTESARSDGANTRRARGENE